MRTLVVAEKFNTALRIAVVLSDGRMKRERLEGTSVFRFERPDGEWSIVGLRGHIVELDYPEELNQWSMEGLPALLEAPPLKRVTATAIVAALETMARGFDRVILATDFDREGELIALECLEILHAVHPGLVVKRARYSALTREEIERSFAELVELDRPLAEAAGARQEIDLVWGALLTRYLTLSADHRDQGFFSAGRVQTPTLALLVARDQEIREFVPSPFWTLRAESEVDSQTFRLQHTHGIFTDRREADEVLAKVKNATKGIVTAFEETEYRRRPPVPFSTTLFIAEASRLGIGAANAMRIGEDLYTRGIISYPRTDNTVYPKGVGLRTLAEKFLESPFKAEAEYVLTQETLRPSRGRVATTDHPPIYPTSVVDPKKLRPDAQKIYELVVRRFLATLAPDAVGRHREATVTINAEPFQAAGTKLDDIGWYRIYTYMTPEETLIPVLTVGANVPVRNVELNEEMTRPPRRYTQGSLVQEMERLGLGTKSTRADVIQKMLDRHYITARQLEPTSTGIAVIEALQAHAPVITRPDMTHRLEEEMGLVAEGKKPRDEVIADSRAMLREAYGLLTTNAAGVRATLNGALDRQHFAGPCPKCGGALRLARSPRGSRWIQCVNNPATCPTSFPLPAAGFVELAPEYLCPGCQTPRVRITFRGQRPDLYCVNPECAEHKKRFFVGSCPSCHLPLAVRYSRFGKRFVGCTGYPTCSVTFPLPQRGRLDVSPEPCAVCHSPEVTAIEAGRPPWKTCINPECPTRVAKREAKEARDKERLKVKRAKEAATRKRVKLKAEKLAAKSAASADGASPKPTPARARRPKAVPTSPVVALPAAPPPPTSSPPMIVPPSVPAEAAVRPRRTKSAETPSAPPAAPVRRKAGRRKPAEKPPETVDDTPRG
jgi:DNA topoisomerase-1